MHANWRDLAPVFWIGLSFISRATAQQFTTTPFAHNTTGLSEACAIAVNTNIDDCSGLRTAIAKDFNNSHPDRIAPLCASSLTACQKAIQTAKTNILRDCTLKTDVYGPEVAESFLSKAEALTDGTVPVTIWVDSLTLIMKQTCEEASTVHLTAPGTVTSCSKWKYHRDTKAPMEFMGKTYRADSKMVNSCWFVLVQEEITPEQLLEWNPSLDSGLARCALQPGYRYCVKKRIPILKTLFKWGWNVYSFWNFCRGVMGVFGW